jgi:multiple sugar transport system permease protein/cellobiose transport system permease protein
MYILFFLYPTVFSFYTSLTNWDSIVGIDKKEFVFFENYKTILTQDPYFFKAVLNTFMFMIIYIPIVVLTGLLLAVIMYRLKIFKNFFQTANMLPYITTPAAIGLMFAFMFDWSTGIVNKILLGTGIIEESINWLGVGKYARIVLIMVLIWKNFGYYFIIYLAGLSTIPKDTMEAAIVDGAGIKVLF